MFIEKVVGDLGDKRRWRQYKARVKALPANYRTTVAALEGYLTYFGMITKGDVPMDVLMSMLGDLVDLFEQAAADGTPIRAVVGDDPVEFAETYFRDHSDGRWIRGAPPQLGLRSGHPDRVRRRPSPGGVRMRTCASFG
jgi:DNA-binding ferritin-like protein (Dps family)